MYSKEEIVSGSPDKTFCFMIRSLTGKRFDVNIPTTKNPYDAIIEKFSELDCGFDGSRKLVIMPSRKEITPLTKLEELLDLRGESYELHEVLKPRTSVRANFQPRVAQLNWMLPENLAQIPSEKINESDHMGRTLLHLAVFYGKTEALNQLLKMNCDLYARDNSGLTALELAQTLQAKFTYTTSKVISLKFFSDKEISVQEPHCKLWKQMELILTDQMKEHSLSS